MAIKLRWYQDEGASAIREKFRAVSTVLYVLSTGGGKCLDPDTLVLMFNKEWRKAKHIVVGDVLMGADAKPRNVLALGRGFEMMYRINPFKGKPYEVNESHILSLRCCRTGKIVNIGILEYLSKPLRWRLQYMGWRVKNIRRGQLGYELTYITVEKIGIGEYCGFQIDGDSLFVVQGFAVTHNTYLFSYIADSAAQKRRHVIILVHRKELLLQASASLTNLGVDHGLISPHFTPDNGKYVQVASIDTILNRLKRKPYHCDLLIVDEAHHVILDNKWGRVYDLLGKPKMLGVTATPVRTDGKGLGSHAGGLFDEMVLGPAIGQLIEMGMLVKPEVYTSLELPDFSDVKRDKDGEYNLQEMAARVDKPKITGSAVEHYKEICPGAQTVVFCSSIEHARHVVAEFNAAGFKFALLVGAPAMSDTERTATNRALRSGDLHGICTVDLVAEGFDLPNLMCCIMLRATQSEALYLQQVGRVMRPADGKTTCYLLDHVGNVGRIFEGVFRPKHGLPHAVREWTLDGRKKKKGGKKEQEEKPDDILQCPKCWKVHDPAPSCPKCGYVYPVGGNNRELEQVDGKLTKIDEELEAAALRSKEVRLQANAKTVEEMIAATGYSEGRAKKIIEAREEKAALRKALIDDLMAWRKQTGQGVETFGLEYMSDLKQYKPKALKELRERFDAHKAAFNQQPAMAEF